MGKSISKEYTFEHDKNIIAHVPAPWSSRALIMNKKRVVICEVDLKQIKNKSWVRIKD